MPITSFDKAISINYIPMSEIYMEVMRMTDNVSKSTREYQRARRNILWSSKILYKKGKRFGDSSCFVIRELL